ncbi:T9SS type A sorting domain-containing protein, partial [candidate division KSB1 bacterium]|nr:T9SS type A sorting domain-containing protein [candidate division KSB1 bacterium]
AFRAAFRDTRADTAVYFAVTPYGFLSPDTLFRIKSNDLQSTQNTADLIIIAHAKFLTEAERLAAHRRSVSGLRVKVVDIADVYNQFNYGIFAAQAIKDFLNYAYSSWQYPAPQFALLLGDGCWDPRKIGGDAVQTTFIPVLGNPVSDSRLVCFDGPEDFLPDMFIGRLPVYTQEEASVIVDKIIQYDLEPIPTHIKKFAFLNGGINTDEQLQFRAQSEELINRYIDPAPVAGEPIRIYKDTDGRTEGEMQPEILQTFADGVSTFVFSGHAASSTWETMLQNEDIDKLQNIDKLPVVFSMTCHTGKFAEPRQVSFAEDFMRLPQRGAAAFWGTSGWGWITQDGWLLDGLFNSLAIDSVREIGALVTAAKLKLHTQHPQTDGRNVNVIDQYTLFGDPSMKLKLPLQPDLYVPPQVISTEPETLSELDSITVLIVKIENLGLATTDSVEINTDIFNSENSLIFSTRSRIAPIGLRDSLRIYWTGQNRRGPYKVQLVVNPLNSIGEVRFDNNSLSQEIYFYSSNLTIAEPAVLTQISETQPTLYVYNPEISQESSASYEFEIDTLSNFTSPFLIQSEKVNEQHVRTGWKVSSVLADGLYFWRCRRNTESIQSPWVNAYFWINSGSSDWSFRQEKQFWPQNGTTYGTQSSGILLPLDNSKTKTLQVRSLGFSDGNGYCDLIIDGQKINTNTDFRGHNLLSIDPVSQQITVGPLNFNTSSSNTASDSMAAVLRDLPDRSMLLIGIHGDGSEAITEAALQEFENFGSAFSGDVSLNDSWSLIGVKGATDKSKTEKRTANGLGPAVVSDTMLQFVQNGEFYSQPLGPALSWGVLHFVQDTFRLIPGPTEIANMHINIEGKLNSQVAWMKINEFSQSGEYDLSAIDVSQFPYLRLHAIFTDDDGLDSPVLRSWQLSYEPAGDIAIDPTSVNLSADSLLAGENIRLSADIYAFNAFTKDSVGIALSVVNDLGDYSTLNSKKIKIPYNNSTRVSFDFMLATQGSHRLKLDIDNLNEVAESHELNNTVNLTAFSRRDEEPPSIQIFVDSKTPLNNEYISATPLILYEIYDDSPAAIQDTSNFVLYLDNKRIYFNSPQPDMELLPKNEDKLRAQILFEPDLTPGNHILSIEVTDAFGYKNNLLQELKVAENFALYDVLNYPNPFSSETVFTFFLTQEAQSVQIKIFTVTGKLIQVLENYSPEIGYNQIPWDSRDHDFDLLANGIYLYKVIAKQNDKTVEFIGKAAIAR